MFSTRSSSSNSSSLQLKTSPTITIRVPASDPTSTSRGKLSRNLFNVSTSNSGQLKTRIGASLDSLIAGDGVGEDGDLLSSGEGGQNGEKCSSRRDHYW